MPVKPQLDARLVKPVPLIATEDHYTFTSHIIAANGTDLLLQPFLSPYGLSELLLCKSSRLPGADLPNQVGLLNLPEERIMTKPGSNRTLAVSSCSQELCSRVSFAVEVYDKDCEGKGQCSRKINHVYY